VARKARPLELSIQKRTSGCWIWTAGKNWEGYGMASRPENGSKLVHRIMWMRKHGKLDPKVMLLHSCDVPACVNPGHLRPGNAKDNFEDRKRRKRWIVNFPLEYECECKNPGLPFGTLTESEAAMHRKLWNHKTYRVSKKTSL
jgi:HNH endonuclease